MRERERERGEEGEREGGGGHDVAVCRLYGILSDSFCELAVKLLRL